MSLELGTPIRALPAVGTPQAHPQPPVLGPSLSGEEATGKVELGLFPLLWGSTGSFGAGLKLWCLLASVAVRGHLPELSPRRAVPSQSCHLAELSPPGSMGSHRASPRRIRLQILQHIPHLWHKSC